MNSKFTDQTKVVRFESTEKEPCFVDAYGAAIESADAFEATLQRLGDLAIASNRELESLRRISLYLGSGKRNKDFNLNFGATCFSLICRSNHTRLESPLTDGTVDKAHIFKMKQQAM